MCVCVYACIHMYVCIFNFKDIDWPDRLNKSGAALSLSEGKILIDIMNDHGSAQLIHFPTRKKKKTEKTNKQKNIGFNTHFSPWSVSGYPLLGQI